jgi:STE24 endopeptidase
MFFVWMINRWLLLVLLGVCAPRLFAFEVDAEKKATPLEATVHATPAAAGELSDPAAATKAWLDTVPLEKRARSDAYFEGRYWLILWNFLLGAAIMLVLLVTGISVRLRNFAERTTRSRWLQSLLYAAPFLLIVMLATFPLTIYQDFIRDHAYGLSTQTFSSWLGDQVKLAAVAFVVLTIMTMILYAVFRRAPRTWWLWGAGVVTLFSIIGTMIAPVYIAPLVNQYKLVADPAIRDPILRMARANQIPVDQVYEFDASRQTNRISANVSGLLGTTRISLNDNLLTQCTLPEIRLVMAHEMGHYVLNHSLGLVIFSGIITLLTFAIARWGFDAVLRGWGSRWQLRDIADPAALPVLVLIVLVVSFLLTPINNSLIRTIEGEADAFAINAARESDGMAKVALKLGSYRKLDPGSVEEFIFFDHPSGRARIRRAMDWKMATLP